MTGESNPEEQPVDSNSGESSSEAESQVLVDSDSSDLEESGSGSAIPVAEGESPEESEPSGGTSESGDSGRLGSLDPTVKLKRLNPPVLLGDDPKAGGSESSTQEPKAGEDVADSRGPESDVLKRPRRPTPKGSNSRRATPNVRQAERRPRPREAVGPPKPDLSPSILQGVQQLTNRTNQLESNTQKIARALVEIVKEGENRKRAYDTLYDEMRQYKENFLWQCQKPLFMDLITLFDSILRIERQYESQVGMEKVSDDFRYLKDELLETLYRYDVELIEEHPEKLDIGFQKPIKRVDTDDPSEDRTVVKVVREGFAREGMILRPQEIVVKRYSEAKEG
jgi:molecular chaperone GrpE